MDRRTFISHAGVAFALGHPRIVASVPSSVVEAETAKRDKPTGQRLAGRDTHCKPVIKMIGVGGFGCNAVNKMPDKRFTGIDYISVDNGPNDLKRNRAENTLDLDCLSGTRYFFSDYGPDVPQINRNAAMEARGRLTAMLQGADVLFVAVGTGGGTGSGAAPAIAEIARDMGVLTVAFLTTPFASEGRYRKELAEASIESLKPHVDSLIVLPNDRLLGKLGAGASLMDAFMTSTDFFNLAICEVAEAIKSPGLVSDDFAGLRTMMSDSGMAMSASGWGDGAERASVATAEALGSLLSDGVNLRTARGVLVNVASSGSLNLSEVDQVMKTICRCMAEDATVFCDSGLHNYDDNWLVVTIVATGLPDAATSIDTRKLA